MKKRHFLKQMPLFLFFFLFFAHSCEKRTSPSPTKFGASESREISCEYLDQFKQYGTQFYEYFKYDLSYVDPQIFLPEEYRDEFMARFDSMNALTSGWEY